MPRLVAGWFSPLTFLLCAGYSGARVTNQESKRQYGEPFAALICVLFALRSTLTLTLTLTRQRNTPAWNNKLFQWEERVAT